MSSAWSLTVTCLSAMTDSDQRFVIIRLQIAHIAESGRLIAVAFLFIFRTQIDWLWASSAVGRALDADRADRQARSSSGEGWDDSGR